MQLDRSGGGSGRRAVRRSLGILATALAAIGLVALPLHANETEKAAPDFEEVVAAINTTMRANLYNPAELDTPAYLKIEQALLELAATAVDRDSFASGFRDIWRGGPFSHVSLRVAQQSADELADYLDGLRVGGGGAVLSWQDDVAILSVNTMMGLDTIEEIDAAYEQIASRDARGLIIDLRQNHGGAFAVLPLVSHLLEEDFDAGSFVSQSWNAAHDSGPEHSDIVDVEPWSGWSIKAFWDDVQTDALTRIRFSPTEPRFDGPVYVLTSRATASAAELAADALKGAGRATLVGETTAGEMLSQKIYDIPGGLHLSLPIADYYSAVHGRIEGAGVTPQLDVAAERALEIALQQLRKQASESLTQKGS